LKCGENEYFSNIKSQQAVAKTTDDQLFPDKVLSYVRNTDNRENAVSEGTGTFIEVTSQILIRKQIINSNEQSSFKRLNSCPLVVEDYDVRSLVGTIRSIKQIVKYRRVTISLYSYGQC